MKIEQNGFDIELETANFSNLEEISNLVNSAYRGESSKKGWTTEADFLGGQRTDVNSLVPLIQKNGSAILLIRQSGTNKMIGCVHVEKKVYGCYAGMLAVDPSLQNRGLGKILLQAAEDFARTSHCDVIEITVLSDRHELIAWYERHGFQKVRETRPFPYGDESFGIPRIQGLHFEVFRKHLINKE